MYNHRKNAGKAISNEDNEILKIEDGGDKNKVGRQGINSRHVKVKGEKARSIMPNMKTVVLCAVSYAIGYSRCAMLNRQSLTLATTFQHIKGDAAADGMLQFMHEEEVNNNEEKKKENGLILPFERTRMKQYLEDGNKMTDSYTYFHNYLKMFGSDQRDSPKDFDTLPLLHIWPVYFEAYHNHWQRFRGKEVVFMEIGVQSGGKIPMLRDYFGPGLTYVGVDVNKSTKKFESADWIHIEIGSSEDPTFLASLKEKYPKVDLFLDDGGHTMRQQRTAMKEMLPHVQSDGVYMCEDLSTSWGTSFQGYPNMDSRDSKFLQETMVGLVHRTMDWFQAGWIPGGVMTEQTGAINDFFGPNEAWWLEFHKTVRHIHYYNQVVVYEKGSREPAFAVKTVGNQIPYDYSGEHEKVDWVPVLDRVSNYTNSEWFLNLKPMMDSALIGSVHSHNNNDDDNKGGMGKNRPFPMPNVGQKYEIFQPLYDMDISKMNSRLFLPPKDFLDIFEERISWAGSMVKIDGGLDLPSNPREHAALMYIEMIKSFVSGRVFHDAELSVAPHLGNKILTAGPFTESHRLGGEDWAFAGDTMTGQKRLDNVQTLLKDVIDHNIAGDYIETGVWRGGSSVLAKAVLNVLESNSQRISYVCDSFMGLPPGEKKLSNRDVGWDNTPYLEVASDIVANNFIKYGLLDSNVVFAKGFFNETMPPLSEKIKSLSIMRLDGDMYESTVDVLYHLYDKLSVGGYVIMDDWFGFPSKTACEDFFAVHDIHPEIIPVDNISAYWKKTDHTQIQYWRYEQSKFTLSDNMKEE